MLLTFGDCDAALYRAGSERALESTDWMTFVTETGQYHNWLIPHYHVYLCVYSAKLCDETCSISYAVKETKIANWHRQTQRNSM